MVHCSFVGTFCRPRFARQALLIWSHQRYMGSTNLILQKKGTAEFAATNFAISLVYPGSLGPSEAGTAPAGSRQGRTVHLHGTGRSRSQHRDASARRLCLAFIDSALRLPSLPPSVLAVSLALDGCPQPGNALPMVSASACSARTYVLAAAAGGRYLGSRAPDRSHRAIYPLVAQ